jgi:dTDP-glucose pyrophosphorylase
MWDDNHSYGYVDSCYITEINSYYLSKGDNSVPHLIKNWWLSKIHQDMRTAAEREEAERQKQIAVYVDPFEAASRV